MVYLERGVDIRNDEQGKNTEKSIFSLVEPSSSYNKTDQEKSNKKAHWRWKGGLTYIPYTDEGQDNFFFAKQGDEKSTLMT